MTEVILVIHLILAITLVGLVLLQRSEGGALGMGGGGGGGMAGFMTGRAAGDLLVGLLLLVPVINLFVWGYLAFSHANAST